MKEFTNKAINDLASQTLMCIDGHEKMVPQYIHEFVKSQSKAWYYDPNFSPICSQIRFINIAVMLSNVIAYTYGYISQAKLKRLYNAWCLEDTKYWSGGIFEVGVSAEYNSYNHPALKYSRLLPCY